MELVTGGDGIRNIHRHPGTGRGCRMWTSDCGCWPREVVTRERSDPRKYGQCYRSAGVILLLIGGGVLSGDGSEGFRVAII